MRNVLMGAWWPPFQDTDWAILGLLNLNLHGRSTLARIAASSRLLA